MGITNFTGGTKPIGATIVAGGLSAGLTVRAWRQGVSYPMTWQGAYYQVTVPYYGTYTVNRLGSSAYIDVFVNANGNYVVTF